MADPPLIDRLLALPALSGIPRAQLEWLAEHGEVMHFEAGTALFSRDRPPPGPYIVLSGRMSLRVDRGGLTRTVRDLGPGTISGLLPYSRMSSAAADLTPTSSRAYSFADEPVDILVIADRDVRELTRECHDFTALCVHEMVDRSRKFRTEDLQIEKLASLGRLSAGLAHELNNPSSAVVRSAKEMDACRREVAAAARALGAAGLTGPQLETLETLEAKLAMPSAEPRTTLEQADREDALEDWLRRHGLDGRLAPPLATSAIEVHDLEALTSALRPDQLGAALRYAAAGATAAQLTSELERGATRIHSLVTAITRHTHMDRAPVAEPVRLEAGLAETLTLIGAKARAKQVSLELRVEPDLPAIQGVAGELNQVWLNLVDNAVDAAPRAGHVTVAAGRDRESIIVHVIDDGAGIPETDLDRSFEPFFTTKAVGEGAGLGLDIALSLVRGHGGRIEVNSGPGHTEFRVSLPLVGMETRRD